MRKIKIITTAAVLTAALGCMPLAGCAQSKQVATDSVVPEQDQTTQTPSLISIQRIQPNADGSMNITFADGTRRYVQKPFLAAGQSEMQIQLQRVVAETQIEQLEAQLVALQQQLDESMQSKGENHLEVIQLMRLLHIATSRQQELVAVRDQLVRQIEEAVRIQQEQRMEERVRLEHTYDQLNEEYAEARVKHQRLLGGNPRVTQPNPMDNLWATEQQLIDRFLEIDLGQAAARSLAEFAERQIAILADDIAIRTQEDTVLAEMEEVRAILAQNVEAAQARHEAGELTASQVNEPRAQLIQHRIRMAERRELVASRTGRDEMQNLRKVLIESQMQLEVLAAQERLLRERLRGIQQNIEDAGDIERERIDLSELERRLESLQGQILEIEQQIRELE